MNSPPAVTIVLATLNARFIHASLGLRYLMANLGELREKAVLREFTISRPVDEIVNELLASLRDAAPSDSPPIVGFGVYIWNVSQTTAVVRRLRAAWPEIRIVLGGPEVSHELESQEIVALADHVITGWGEVSFAALCRALAEGGQPPKRIAGVQPPLAEIAFPYAEYSDADLAHRLLYVEASRGCPFKCEFCLSALDKTAWPFNLDAFLDQLRGLFARGARHFKFVDRTFNLRIDASARLLQFFLDRLDNVGSGARHPGLFLHFEVVPDHLPEALKALVRQFPPGVLQFEVGVQSFDSEVQRRISRRQDNVKTEANLRWLIAESNAHVHADLIFGLPGESLAGFAAGFDRLYAIGPHEIQLGLLKRLRGTPIARHSNEFAMEYEASPPYTVLSTSVVDAATMQRFTRFARYWDRIANSGRFRLTLPLLMNTKSSADAAPRDAIEPSAFAAFLGFSDWLWERTGRTDGLAPEALVDALFDYLHGVRGLAREAVLAALVGDYVRSGARSNPAALRGRLPRRDAPRGKGRGLAPRQERHK